MKRKSTQGTLTSFFTSKVSKPDQEVPSTSSDTIPVQPVYKELKSAKKIALDLEVAITKIGRVLGVRWVASSFVTFKSVWKSYPALVTHFKAAADDTSRNDKERAKFRGLFLRLESVEFLCDLALMYDVLEELSSLSLQLQDRLCTIPKADKLIRRTIRVLLSMKNTPGECEILSENAKHTMKFKGITLKNNSRVIVINRLQFLTSLANNLESRCFATTASNRQLAGNETERSEYVNLLADMDVLNPETWDEQDEERMDVRFGETNILNLCARFRLDNSLTILGGFRDFYESGGRRVPASMLPLTQCMDVLPCSTAECERGFSAMNLVVSPLRTKLLLKNVAALMFIKLNGPPLNIFQPCEYVKSWLIHHRSAESSQSRHVDHNIAIAAADTKNELWPLF